MKDNLRYVTEVGIGNWACPSCKEECEVERTLVYENCVDRETGEDYKSIMEVTDTCIGCGHKQDTFKP